MKVGFFGLLTLIFVTLKLTSIIDWSWWLVLSPSITAIVLWFIAIFFILWMDKNDPLWRYRK